MIQYIVPIVALFQGRVIDQPEQTMVETQYSTGADVGHEVSWVFICASSIGVIFMISGILFLVIEFKLGVPNHINLAQPFLELLCAYFHSVYILSIILSRHLCSRRRAAEQNNQLDFAGLRICGLLTDLTQFKFYSYDPSTKQFCFDERILTNNRGTDAILRYDRRSVHLSTATAQS